ncbi:hypothetical protein, partial [Streptomyces griseus]|uniref:hypothetical protein n=1 Tax=Streptomyces griseus TaxID=1911 RepID=UPI001F22EB35
MERFVIERFTPRPLIDIELVGEGVTAGPRDAVDFDLENRGLGTRATPRGNVQEREARKDQGDANTEGGLEVLTEVVDHVTVGLAARWSVRGEEELPAVD